MNDLLVGCHLSTSNGYAAMAADAVSIGATTFAFFTRNPRGGNARELDAQDLEGGTTLEELGADHEDLVELAWQLGEAAGVEIDEARLADIATIDELWSFVRELEEEAE